MLHELCSLADHVQCISDYHEGTNIFQRRWLPSDRYFYYLLNFGDIYMVEFHCEGYFLEDTVIF
jgi:hypothetical protein